MNAQELSKMMLQTVKDLRAASADLELCSVNFAKAERDYRLARAKAFLGSHGSTVAEREAHSDEKTSDARFARDMSEGLKVSALEAVRSHRGVLSALQSLAALERSEAELAKYAPQEAYSEP